MFIDLTKAFDTVSREALWKILLKLGCPTKFVNVLKQLHEGMQARVCSEGQFSDSFPINNGVKQGCVVAPILFILFFGAMLKDCLDGNDKGIRVNFRTNGGLFNLQRLRAKTKIREQLVRELLFADDCGIFAHSVEDLQSLMDSFANASRRFDLTISIKKTEVLCQPPPGVLLDKPSIIVNGQKLKTTKTFPYLGSTISDDAQLDHEIERRIAKASSSFGRLKDRVWKSHDIKLETKIALFKAVVISMLLYGGETWTLYARHIKKLEAFQQRSLRSIMRVKWEEKTPHSEVLERAKCCSIESILKKRQLQWAGHIVRMDDERLPKILLYGELQQGNRMVGRPRKRYKDSLKDALKSCNVPLQSWETHAEDRASWRTAIHTGVQSFEAGRTERIRQARLRRKWPDQADATGFTCDVCQRPCASRAGLVAHGRVHRR